MRKRFIQQIICFAVSIVTVIQWVPQATYALTITETDENGGTYTYYWPDEENGYSFGWTYEWSSGNVSGGAGSSSGQGASSTKPVYEYEKATDIQKVKDICKKYNTTATKTGVRSQVQWMNQLFVAVVKDFNAQLSLGDSILIGLLNHSDINTTLLTSSYSTGDINREIAKKIAEGAEGYVDVETIAEATGLSAKTVRGILERIASGGITAKTIAVGKNRSRASSRGVYVNHQALKQDKVWKYLEKEIERMSSDPVSLETLYSDLGEGYVGNMLSGQTLDKYQVSLYKEYLAKTLDAVLESEHGYSVATFSISDTEEYKVTKKTRSLLSKVFGHEVGAEMDDLSEEAKAFLDEHLKNGKFSEAEAKEFLILTGEYESGEYGIGEAAKHLINGYEHLKGLKKALDASGKIIDFVDDVKTVEEYIDYWAADYAEQEIMLDYLVENLSNSGADMNMMAAARELQQEYEDKMAGTWEKVYVALINEGIGTVKSTFRPLGIAETAISLSAMLTGADDKVDALETGFAMQGICQQALEDYEAAILAVKNGNTGEEAVSRVLTTFELARQSLIAYYEAMVELTEDDEQKNLYSGELKKLEAAEFGYAVVSLPYGGGSR